MAQILAKRELASGHIAWVAMSEVADGDMSIGNYQARENLSASFTLLKESSC